MNKTATTLPSRGHGARLMAPAMQQTLELITPSLAREYLKINKNPRRLSVTHVASFVGKLKAGEFETTHQGILLTENGELKDGQHRLSAIAESGISAWMWVATGASEDEVLAVDRGMSRSDSVVLGVDPRVGPVISYATYMCFPSRGKALTSDLLFVKDRIAGLCSDLVASCGGCKRSLTSAPVKLGAVLNALRSKRHKQYAFSQYRNFVTGQFDMMTPAVQSFYRRLVASDRKVTHQTSAAISFVVFNEDNSSRLTCTVTDAQKVIKEMVALITG